jgi:hypothetical protein
MGQADKPVAKASPQRLRATEEAKIIKIKTYGFGFSVALSLCGEEAFIAWIDSEFPPSVPSPIALRAFRLSAFWRV